MYLYPTLVTNNDLAMHMGEVYGQPYTFPFVDYIILITSYQRLHC
jgi:hypothetical protein